MIEEPLEGSSERSSMYKIYAWKDTGYFSLYSDNIDKHILRSKDPVDLLVKARQMNIYIGEYKIRKKQEIM